MLRGAGISAEASATPVPVSSAAGCNPAAGDPRNCSGALVVKRALTVPEIIPTNEAARIRPSAIPSTEPAAPSIVASPRNTRRTPRELIPIARRMPISVRRRTTLTAIVL